MSKLILITGISKGLGYAMTEGFIQQGHTIIGCARSSDAIDKKCNSDVYDGLRLRYWLNVVQLRKFLCQGKGTVTKKQPDFNCIGLSPRGTVN